MAPLSLSPAPQTPAAPLLYSSPGAQPSSKSIHHWKVTSHFKYRPRGPLIHYLNNQLIGAVMEAFLLQAQQERQKRNGGARKNVHFFPISRADVQDWMARESLSWRQCRDSLEKRRVNRGP